MKQIYLRLFAVIFTCSSVSKKIKEKGISTIKPMLSFNIIRIRILQLYVI